MENDYIFKLMEQLKWKPRQFRQKAINVHKKKKKETVQTTKSTHRNMQCELKWANERTHIPKQKKIINTLIA